MIPSVRRAKGYADARQDCERKALRGEDQVCRALEIALAQCTQHAITEARDGPVVLQLEQQAHHPQVLDGANQRSLGAAEFKRASC